MIRKDTNSSVPPRRVNIAQTCLLAVFLISSISWGCYLYKPLPEGLSNPWKVRCILAIFKTVEDLATSLDRLGVASKITTIRTITNGLSYLMWSDSTGLQVEDTVFDGVKVRVYDPQHKQPGGAAIVFYHGGGWFFCNVDVHDHITRMLARRLKMVVVSVDYRLAPEHPFPAPLSDCLTATRHFLRHARHWGVSPHRVAVMGDSAGGNLAAAVSLTLAPSAVRPALQILVYPALQAADFSLPSYVANDDRVYGSRASMAEVTLYYTGQRDTRLAQHLVTNNHSDAAVHARIQGDLDLDLASQYSNDGRQYELSDDLRPNLSSDLRSSVERMILHPQFSPLLARSFSGVCPAYIVTAEYDVLRDDGALYQRRLEKAGVKVTRHHVEDAFHGFWAFLTAPIKLDAAHRAMDGIVEHIANNL